MARFAHRFSTFLDVALPLGGSLDNTVLKVEVVQDQSSHDIVSVFVNGVVPNYRETLRTGAPITVTYGMAPDSTTFYGYVNHVRPVRQGSRVNWTQVVCVGATFPLKERVQRSWSNVRASDVVVDVLRDFGLTPDVQATTTVYPNVSTDGGSYWSLFRRLARENGYVLRADGSAVRFLPRSTMYARGTRTAPVYWLGGPPSDWMGSARTLESFDVASGDYMPESPRAVRVVSGVDPVSAEAFSVTVDGLPDDPTRTVWEPLFTHYSDRAAVDPGQAQRIGEAEAEQDRWVIRATATGASLPRVQPDSVVYVSGVGDQEDGYWTVLRAVHTISNTGHSDVALVLGTDGVGKNGEPPDSRNVLDLRLDVGIPNPNTVLRDGYRVPVTGTSGYRTRPARWVSEVVR